MEASVEWTSNKNFLLRSFTVREGDKLVRSGKQVIGWDPRSGQITTWTFGSDGGHARGYWSDEGDGWSEHVEGTTADGELFNSTNVVSQISEDELLWQSVDRSIEGYPLADTTQVRVVRVKQ